MDLKKLKRNRALRKLAKKTGPLMRLLDKSHVRFTAVFGAALLVVLLLVLFGGRKHGVKNGSEMTAGDGGAAVSGVVTADADGTAAGDAADISAAGDAGSGLPGGADADGTAAGALSAAESVSSAEEIPETEGPKGEVSITVSAVGDVTLGRDKNMEYDVSFDAKYEEVGDPSWFLENVRDVFATDDLTIINFEGTFTTGGERADKTFAFKADPSYVEILTSGSVEAANLANNHSFDYGRDAYEETKKTLEDAGIVSFGYDRSRVIDVKGIKVGLVGIYELEAELGCKDLLLEQIKAVQDEGAKLVIVSFHWGDEGTYDINDIQIELAHAAVDAGAHLVIGHHPHRLQGVGHYNGVYICYSLGNFCFGGNAYPSDMDSMIFRQTFTFEDGELTDRDEHLIIPCRISSKSDYNNYRPIILEGDEEKRVRDKIEGLL